MLDSTLAFTSAGELKGLIQQKKLSPVELVELLLRRIREWNPKLNAYLTVNEENVRAKARQAEDMVMRRKRLPPLCGIPMSVKDLIFTRGLRTTGGSLVYHDFVPTEDATVVERLRQAGAIILGKTNTSEFGLSATTENYLGDHCRNPWNIERTSGGSSGGAASAVAAGLGPLALGSDGGGSIRIPSAFCGIYGIKPSQGRVSSYGCFGGMPLFSQVGPIARTVRDAALLLGVIAGTDSHDPYCHKLPAPDFLQAVERPSGPWRIAWSPDLGYAPVDPQVRQATVKAARSFEARGCIVEEVFLKLDDPFSIFATIVLADGYAAHGHLLEKHSTALMPYVRSSLEAGRKIAGYEYSRALENLERFRSQMVALFQHYDLLLTPTTAVPAFPIGQRPGVIAGKTVSKLWGPFPFTLPFNLTGQPAANLPCGFSSDGLPIGLHMVGRYGEESTVLRASAAFETAHPWAEKRPC